MVLRKINKLILIMVAGLMVASCQMADQHNHNSSESGMARKEMKDELLRQMTRDVFYQDSVLRVINNELQRIDAMYIAFEGGIENNRQSNGHAEDIINRIKHLNKILESTRKELRTNSLDNDGFLEMIARLEKELAEKEKEITELQIKVSEQETIIAQKEEQIDWLEIANEEKERQIARMENEIKGMKAKAYTELADLLIQIATEMPEVRGIFVSRTRADVELMQEELIRDAHRYYDEAALFGNSYARFMASELKNEYAFL